MSEDELAAIEARAKAATEGPWEADAYDRDTWHIWSTAPNTNGQHLVADTEREADAEFCAAARQDVPALAAALREARCTIEIAAGRFTREVGGAEYVCTRHNTPSCPSCLAYAMGGLKAALE